MSQNTRTLIAAAAAAALAPFTAQAGDAEDALVAKVVNAYGGDALTQMQSIRINDSYKNGFPGQGYTPEMVEFTHLRQDAQLDLDDQRGSVEAFATNWNFSFHNRTVSAGDDIVTINYLADTYQPAAFADYYTAFGAVIRVTDTLLAYELARNAETAEHLGASTYLGRPHEMISFEIPASPPLTLHVDAQSGLISKMTRATGFGALNYQFRNHGEADGVAYARDFEFFLGSDANIITLRRDVAVNTVRDSAFDIDRGVVEEPARIDTSEMSVDEIAEGVHLAGIGGPGAAAYTVFVDAGDHLIAVGGYAGLQDRYDAYIEATGTDKPVRHQIVTHHHTDHLGGMAEALAMGASFVTPANAVSNLNAAAGEDISADRLQVLDEQMTLGPVEIYDVTTNHMESMALVYIPSAKAIFQADHYNGVYEGDAAAPAGIGAVMLKDAVDALSIDVDIVLSAHGRKAVSWSEFAGAVAAYDPDPCPSRRPICRAAMN